MERLKLTPRPTHWQGTGARAEPYGGLLAAPQAAARSSSADRLKPPGYPRCWPPATDRAIKLVTT